MTDGTAALQATEDASAAVATAPRITLEFIQGQIERQVFCTGDTIIAGGVMPSPDGHEAVAAPDAWQPLYSHHTICMLTTKGGFTVIGHSAPMDPANFHPQLGRQLSYDNAFRQLWPLFAFANLENAKQD